MTSPATANRSTPYVVAAAVLAVVTVALAIGAVVLLPDADARDDSLTVATTDVVDTVLVAAATIDTAANLFNGGEGLDTTDVLDAVREADAMLTATGLPEAGEGSPATVRVRALAEAHQQYLAALAVVAARPQSATSEATDVVRTAFDEVASSLAAVGSAFRPGQRDTLVRFLDEVLTRAEAEVSALDREAERLAEGADEALALDGTRTEFDTVIADVLATMDDLAAARPRPAQPVFRSELDGYIAAHETAIDELRDAIDALRAIDIDSRFVAAHALTVSHVDGLVTTTANAVSALLAAACPDPPPPPGDGDGDDSEGPDVTTGDQVTGQPPSSTSSSTTTSTTAPPCPPVGDDPAWQSVLDASSARLQQLRDAVALWHEVYEQAVVEAFA